MSFKEFTEKDHYGGKGTKGNLLDQVEKGALFNLWVVNYAQKTEVLGSKKGEQWARGRRGRYRPFENSRKRSERRRLKVSKLTRVEEIGDGKAIPTMTEKTMK